MLTVASLRILLAMCARVLTSFILLSQGFEPMGTWTDEARDEELRRPTPNRIFALADAFYNAGYSVDKVHDMTKIDRSVFKKQT